MWFPFSEFGMVIHCNRGEWVGGEEVKEGVLVSPPVHLGIVSSIAVTAVEVTKAT